jgi:hypothetical protein
MTQRDRVERGQVARRSDALALPDLASADARVRLRPTALEIHESVDAAEWLEIGRRLGRIESGCQWWLGDYVNFGERKKYIDREKYDDVVRVTGKNRRTLSLFAWVARRVKSSTRVDDLHWSHHRKVALADLTERQQTQWLQRALKEDWSKEELGREIARWQRTERIKELAAKATKPLDDFAEVRCASMADLLGELRDLDVILTDPPYGYDALPLYGELARLAKFALAPHGLLAVMCGQSYLPEIYAAMAAAMPYRWTLAYLTPGGQSVQLWDRKVNTFWKPVLVFGAATEWFGDVARSEVNDNDKGFHDWGQSESGMADLVEKLTQPGQVICDPFLGAGTTGVAAIRRGRRFIGGDINAECVATARLRLQAAIG